MILTISLLIYILEDLEISHLLLSHDLFGLIEIVLLHQKFEGSEYC